MTPTQCFACGSALEGRHCPRCDVDVPENVATPACPRCAEMDQWKRETARWKSELERANDQLHGLVEAQRAVIGDHALCGEVRERLQAAVRELERERNEARGALPTLMSELEKALGQRDALQAELNAAVAHCKQKSERIRELESGITYSVCAYCGARFKETGTELISAHVRVCEKHPLRADVDRLRARVQELARVGNIGADECRRLLGEKLALHTRVQQLEGMLRQSRTYDIAHGKLVAEYERLQTRAQELEEQLCKDAAVVRDLRWERDRLRAQLATARAALEWYADETRWKYLAYRGHSSSANEDAGDRARQALAALDRSQKHENGDTARERVAPGDIAGKDKPTEPWERLGRQRDAGKDGTK